MRRLWNARVAKSRSLVMKAGNKVIEKVNKQPFIDAMKPVYAKFAPTKNLKDLVKRIQAVK
jgi:TRAP-type C4-dicarboxylate transport system substrate-binding protein